MPRKRNPNIPNKEPATDGGYISLGGDFATNKESQIQVSRAISSIQPILHSPANSATASTSAFTVREGLSRFDYEIFRPGERVPVRHTAILEACMGAYERISIIRNVIDLMGDFTSQGIKIVHPNPQIEKFYNNWWVHINGFHISERFANSFYRTGNPIVRRNMAKIANRVIDDLKRGIASDQFSTAAPLNLNNTDKIPEDYFSDTFFDDYDEKPEVKDKNPKNVLPWGYELLNPLFVTLLGGDLALFSGQRRYGLKIPDHLIGVIRSPKNGDEQLMVDSIPDYIVSQVRAGSQTIPLDPTRISVYHYKKDSWEAWATPMVYSIMDELIILQKLKMADLAALDGAISHIRVWKLGKLEGDIKLFPTEAMIQKLSEVLSAVGGNGQAADIIWGPDISIEETKSDLSGFLGMAKYEPTLNSIYAGLGIPPTLTGSGGSSGGFTNNFLSLKTLVERLNYGRDALTRFWEHEIKLVQQAMGFRFPARIEFKNMVLTDETAQQRLLLDLLDRDVIGLDRVREHLGYIPAVEEAAIRRDYKNRDSKKIPPKVSPYHDAHPELTLQKIFAQTGVVTPGQVGVELSPKGKGEESSIDMQNKQVELQQKQHQLSTDQFQHQKKTTNIQLKQGHELNLQKQKDDTQVKKLAIKKGINPNQDSSNSPTGESGQGRPPGSNDTQKRAQKRVLPRSKADSDIITLQLWANDAQQRINEIMNPFFLKQCNKKNMRQLTASETESYEHLKWAVLCNTKPLSKITPTHITSLLTQPLGASPQADNYWKVCVANYVAQNGVAPAIEDVHQIQSYVYALEFGEYENTENIGE